MMLISLEQARAHLRIDTMDDDADLELKIHAASAAVANYLGDAADDFLDTDGDPFMDSSGDAPFVPFEVKAATLLMLGALYKDRDGSEQFQQGYLPAAVTALLYPLRDPVME